MYGGNLVLGCLNSSTAEIKLNSDKFTQVKITNVTKLTFNLSPGDYPLFVTGSNDSVISCCNQGTVRPPSELHPECLHIDISPTDRFFSRFGQRCMNFVRSLPSVPQDCSLGPRQQMNQITGFIDARYLYHCCFIYFYIFMELIISY